jgi:hypothetical protein
MPKYTGFTLAFLLTACLNDPNDAPEISEAQIQALTFELRLASYNRFHSDRNDTLPKNIDSADTLSRRILKDEQVDMYLMIGNFPRNVRMDIQAYSMRLENGLPDSGKLVSRSRINTCCTDANPGGTFMQIQLAYFPNSSPTPFKRILSVEMAGRERFRDSILIR